MGSEVIARCECGINAKILIGGGMESHMHTCYFPCLCELCHKVVQVNLLAKRVACPKCKKEHVTPYDDPKLIGKIGGEEITSWDMAEEVGRILILTDGDYLCPKCGKSTLHFEESGLCWD
jgi:Zn finger protein HypA/HybF involved in hydrogenase expression